MSARAEPRNTARLVLALALAGSLSACAKSRATTAAPESAPLTDDLASIDARLSANADELRREGVALAEPGGAGATGDPVEGGAAGEDDAEVPAEAEAGPSRDDAVEREELSAPSRVSKRKARERPRCERICDLAESTCDLRARICDLARVHDGDARYEDACDRATTQCEAAQAACTRCR